MGSLEWTAFVLGLVLQILLITTLVRRFDRHYIFLFLLIVVEFLSSVVNAANRFDLNGWTRSTARFYWIAEGVHFTLIYACLVQMLYQTISDLEHRRRLLYVSLGGVLFAILSATQGYHERPAMWMTQFVRNVSFGSTFIALTVWTLSIRKPNRERLMIVAAMGVQLAGTAIGHSLRQLSRTTVPVGNVILLVCYVLFLYILWKALTLPPQAPPHSQNPDPPETHSNEHEPATTLTTKGSV